MEFNKSKTYLNLLAAFAGEAQASIRYQYFAKKAKKEGYEQIAAIFDTTSKNEYEHAYLWAKRLDMIQSTSENLQRRAEGEHYEWDEMYRGFAQTAREEGYNDIAAMFDGVASVEKEHEQRYLQLKQNIAENKVFNRSPDTYWICRNCGYIMQGATPPEICPVCVHPQAYFEIKPENY